MSRHSIHAFDNSTVLQAWGPWTARRTRGARPGHTNAGFDHQLHQRFQSDDDPFARGHSPGPAAAQRAACARRGPRNGDGMNGVLSVHGHRKCLKSEGINMMHKFFMALCLLCVAEEHPSNDQQCSDHRAGAGRPIIALTPPAPTRAFRRITCGGCHEGAQEGAAACGRDRQNPFAGR